MAMFLVLKFEDDEDANNMITSELSGQPDIIGMYKAPTVFCECRSVKQRGWGRGQKWGWWVCSLCGKPSRGIPQVDKFEYVEQMGFNLLGSIAIEIHNE